ncbi:MAG: cytochrome c [Acidobacteriaceae bacterium]|nr:cytochrome c [Acidobacteriaceae bacterium]
MGGRITALLLLVTLLALVSNAAWAADGAALYKSKGCAGCHGADGAGKPPKIPALKGTSLSQDQIATMLEKGSPDRKAPHNASKANAEDAKAIAEYVKSLK